MTNDDPTRAEGRWDALFALLRTIDGEIETLYRRRGEDRVRSRFAFPMIRIAHEGPMTIARLAESLERTHSAMSQTVAAMKAAGIVASIPGADARTKVIELTERGRTLIPLVEAEWRATEAAIAELDAETTVPLSQVVAELDEAVRRRSMSARFEQHFAQLTDERRPG